MVYQDVIKPVVDYLSTREGAVTVASSAVLTGLVLWFGKTCYDHRREFVTDWKAEYKDMTGLDPPTGMKRREIKNTVKGMRKIKT